MSATLPCLLEMNDDYKHNYMLGIVYEAVSRLMPAMGKDFKVNVQFLDDNHMNITVEDLTPVGTAIKRVLLTNLDDKIKTVQKEKEEEYGQKRSTNSTPGDSSTVPGDSSAPGPAHAHGDDSAAPATPGDSTAPGSDSADSATPGAIPNATAYRPSGSKTADRNGPADDGAST